MSDSKRSYAQFCAVARALDLVGERWTLLLVRDLMLGPKRFKDLLKELPGIGTNLLSERLKGLEASGILAKRVLPPPAGSTVYELTDVGRGLEPVVFALGRWGHQFLYPRKRGENVHPGWFVVSLRATFRPSLAAGERLALQLNVNGQPFEVAVEDGAARITAGAAARRDATLTTDVDSLIALVAGDLSPDQALGSGRLQLDGDRSRLERFVELFGWRTEAPSVAQLVSR